MTITRFAARAASGHATAAPLSIVMNSRRFTRSPRRRVRATSAALLLRLGLRDLRDQLLSDGVAEGIEVLRDRDERADAADDVVAIVVCKPAGRVGVAGIGVAGIGVGGRLGQGGRAGDRGGPWDAPIPR